MPESLSITSRIAQLFQRKVSYREVSERAGISGNWRDRLTDYQKSTEPLLTSEQRAPVVAKLEEAVRENIKNVRSSTGKISSRYPDARLLLRSLLTKEGDENESYFNGFGSWYWLTAIQLGPVACGEIGRKVCTELGFTAEEAKKHLKKLEPGFKKYKRKAEKNKIEARF